MNLHFFNVENGNKVWNLTNFSDVFYESVICILLNIELEFSAKRRCDSFLNKAQNLLTAIELNIIFNLKNIFRNGVRRGDDRLRDVQQ